MKMRTTVTLLMVALATFAYGEIGNCRVGVFFDPPGTTNGFVDIAAGKLCRGREPTSVRKIPAASMLTILDGYAERYYIPLALASDVDGWRADAGVYPSLAGAIDRWKQIDFIDEYELGYLWPLATNRNFSALFNIFPRGRPMLAEVRDVFRDSVRNGSAALFRSQLGFSFGSSWFGSDRTLDVGWTNNTAFRDAVFSEMTTNGFGKTYCWFVEAITNVSAYLPRMASCIEYDRDSESESALLTNMQAIAIAKDDTLQAALEAHLPSAEGGLTNGWLTATNNPSRMLASDFSWLNALIASMNVSSLNYPLGPYPRFLQKGYTSSTNGSATVSLRIKDLDYVPGDYTNHTTESHFTLDAKVLSVVPNGYDPPVETNKWTADSAAWSLDVATIGVKTSHSIERDVRVSAADLEDAILRVGYDPGPDWEIVQLERLTEPLGIHVYVALGNNRDEVAFVPAEELEEFYADVTITNAEYSVNTETAAPFNDNPILLFARQGQAWYHEELSGPSLSPSMNTYRFASKISVQGCAKRTVDTDSTNIVERMARGASTDSRGADALASDICMHHMIPGCSDIAAAITGIDDLRNVRAIESVLRSRITSEQELPFMIGFDGVDGLQVRRGSQGLEFGGTDIDDDKVLVGHIHGTIDLEYNDGLPRCSVELQPRFSLLIRWRFYNLPTSDPEYSQ